jgi:CBS domain-containing protein/predicted DCC family thiol-disulfide oxidoreductase YuxK
VVVRAQSQEETSERESRDVGTRAEAYSNKNLDRLELMEPDDMVEDIMTPASACATARSENTLAEGRKILQDQRVEGVPVVDGVNRVVGVISRHDLRPMLQRSNYKTYLVNTTVGQAMSTPPVCVRPHARIGEAAGVMLAYKVHRLPVVNEEGSLLGIVSRTDIFQPLLRKKESIMGSERRLWINGSFPDNSFVDLDGFDSLASVEGFPDDFSSPSGGGGDAQTWEVKYLYDGECNLCMMLVDMLKRRADEGAICFVNLRDPDYDPLLNQGISFEDGMESIHVIKQDQQILRGPEALQYLYDVANLGWVQRIMQIPFFSYLAGIAYKVIAALRLPLQGESMDALLAARRMRSAENDDLDWQCTDDDDDGCEVPDDW